MSSIGPSLQHVSHVMATSATSFAKGVQYYGKIAFHQGKATTEKIYHCGNSVLKQIGFRPTISTVFCAIVMIEGGWQSIKSMRDLWIQMRDPDLNTDTDKIKKYKNKIVRNVVCTLMMSAGALNMIPNLSLMCMVVFIILSLISKKTDVTDSQSINLTKYYTSFFIKRFSKVLKSPFAKKNVIHPSVGFLVGLGILYLINLSKTWSKIL